MPAVFDDPTALPIQAQSSGEPYPADHTLLPSDIGPRQLTLRDRSTAATCLPFSNSDQIPPALLAEVAGLLNAEIEKGDTYPMLEPMATDDFGRYWFANFGAVMLLGNIESTDVLWKLAADSTTDWKKLCLGSFYIKPNYPGRSSHICNGGFLVSRAARNRGVGKLMGGLYLEWAPKLNYTYSIFNLVYETNLASIRIWDALGFKRVGRVKGAGNLKDHDGLTDAIIYGRGLDAAPEDYLNEERFDRIRAYLRTGQYPDASDRAEKGRLRSAAIHYRLLPATTEEGEKLMLKDKEVISEPAKQFEIAHRIHTQHHGGINKTTAMISEKYHWVRIKETVSQAIKHCQECKEGSKPPRTSLRDLEDVHSPSTGDAHLQQQHPQYEQGPQDPHGQAYQPYPEATSTTARLAHDMSTMDRVDLSHDPTQQHQHQHQPQGQTQQSPASIAARHAMQMPDAAMFAGYEDIVDPTIMQDTSGVRAAPARMASQPPQHSMPSSGVDYGQDQNFPALSKTSDLRDVHTDGVSERAGRTADPRVKANGASTRTLTASPPPAKRRQNHGPSQSFVRAWPQGDEQV